jgi:predicted sulfurtransferase
MKNVSTLMHYLFFVSAITLFSFSNAYTEDQKVCQDISAPEVKNMLDHGTAMVVHVMSSFEYNIQHIENSINIPINKLMQQKDKLPKDKTFPIIFYCMGKR